MHIRDEHLQQESKKKLRTRLFGVNIQPEGAHTAAPSQPPVLANINSSGEPADDSGIANTSSETPESRPVANTLASSLRTLSSRLIDLVDADEDPDGVPTDEGIDNEEPLERSISNLFDFDKKDWVSSAQRSAMKSLEDEINFYDLVDLDAAGEADLDYDIDDSVESVFTI